MDGRDLAPDAPPAAFPASLVPESGTEDAGKSPTEPEIPLRAAWSALLALFLGAAVSILTGGIAYALWSETDAPSIVAGALGLYGVVAFVVVRASRRWGSGRIAADLGLRFRWSDLGWGPLTWLLAFVSAIVVGVVLQPFPELQGTNTDILTDDPPVSVVAAMGAIAILAAPLFEELLFRGLMLRALLSSLPPPLAIGLQSIAFGMVHVQPDEGMGNIGLIVTLAAVGAAFGVAAYRSGRLGPAIVGHAIFNTVATVATLVTA